MHGVDVLVEQAGGAGLLEDRAAHRRVAAELLPAPRRDRELGIAQQIVDREVGGDEAEQFSSCDTACSAVMHCWWV